MRVPTRKALSALLISASFAPLAACDSTGGLRLSGIGSYGYSEAPAEEVSFYEDDGGGGAVQSPTLVPTPVTTGPILTVAGNTGGLLPALATTGGPFISIFSALNRTVPQIDLSTLLSNALQVAGTDGAARVTLTLPRP